MPRKHWIGQDESADIVEEARRILADRDGSALAPKASLAGLAEVLADIFDESYTAERVVDIRWTIEHRRRPCPFPVIARHGP